MVKFALGAGARGCRSVRGLAARRRERRGERGSAVVEFALVLLPLTYIVFGVIQYGWYFYSMQAGTAATSDVVRRLSVGDCQDSVALTNLLNDRLGSASASPDSAVTTVTYTDDTSDNLATEAPGVVGGEVTVTVRFDSYDFKFPFVPLPDDGTVTRTAVARVEDTIASAGGC